MDKKNPARIHPKIAMYQAQKKVFDNLEPVIKVLVNLHEMCDEVAEQHDVDAMVLREWILNQLPNIETHVPCDDEDQEDEDDE